MMLNDLVTSLDHIGPLFNAMASVLGKILLGLLGFITYFRSERVDFADI